MQKRILLYVLTTRANIYRFAIALFLLPVLVGCNSKTNSENSNDDASQYLLLKNAQWSSDDSGRKIITGTIVNNSTKTCRYVAADFSYLDASGAQVGSHEDNTMNLEAGQSWKFEEDPSDYSNVTDFRVKVSGNF